MRERKYLEEHPVIRFTGDCNFPPFSYADSPDRSRSMGYEQELLKFLELKFSKLNVDVVIRQMHWQDAVKALRSKQSDVISGIIITENRKKYYTFTEPYMQVSYSMVQSKKIKKLHSLEDAAGYNIIAVKDYSTEELLKSNGINSYHVVSDIAQAVELLKKDDSYIWLELQPTAVYMIHKYGMADRFNVTTLDIPQPAYAMACSRDNEVLAGILTKALRSLDSENIFHYLDNKYFGVSLQRNFHQLNTVIGSLLFILSTIAYVAFLNSALLKNKVDKKTKQIRLLYSQLQNSFNNTLSLAASAVDARDSYTSSHSQKVAVYSTVLASYMNLDSDTITKIFQASLLHDIGKIAVPDEILLKPGRLTDDEYEVIKQHPLIGADMLRTAGGPIAKLAACVQNHHERYDGKGYPNGIQQRDIATAIISFSDALDAMASNRPYRKAISSSEILKEIKAQKGRQFHPTVVDSFIDLLLYRYGEINLDKFLQEAEDIFNSYQRNDLPLIHNKKIMSTAP
nr:HD domain-containing phosphohydrolase [Desulforadius tongensis]